MKVSLVTRYPYLWHNITVTDDVNLKNRFLCYLLGDDFSGDLIFNSDLQEKKLLPSFIWPQLYIVRKLCTWAASYFRFYRQKLIWSFLPLQKTCRPTYMNKLFLHSDPRYYISYYSGYLLINVFTKVLFSVTYT
jgi:hypothetical protein